MQQVRLGYWREVLILRTMSHVSPLLVGLLGFSHSIALIDFDFTAPIAWPTAKFLDWALGANEENTYKKAELKSFLQFHRHGEEPLRDDEIRILNGVLELNTKNVEEIMTPMEDVVTLSADAVLDHAMVDKM